MRTHYWRSALKRSVRIARGREYGRGDARNPSRTSTDEFSGSVPPPLTAAPQ